MKTVIAKDDRVIQDVTIEEIGTETKKAIVIGASSGIGAGLVRELSQNGYEVGMASRRINLLEDIQKELPNKSHIKQMDITNVGQAINQLYDLITEMNGVDLIIISSGVLYVNSAFEWGKVSNIIDVNVFGFTAVAQAAMKYFCARGSGHLVGMSSIGAYRGSGVCPAYCASKAYVSNYLEGLRYMAENLQKKVYVTELSPGYIDTPMTDWNDKRFWVATTEKACKQMLEAIKKRKKSAIIPRRWVLIAFLMKIMPDWLYNYFDRDSC